MKTQQKDNQFGQGSKIDNRNKQFMSPRRNPNIGGEESEYETSDEDNFDEADLNEEDSEQDNLDEDGVVNRRDSEEITRHDDESKYSSPGWRKDADGNISV